MDALLERSEKTADACITLAEYVAAAPDERTRTWTKAFLRGESFGAISAASGRSETQVGITVIRFLRDHPPLAEDKWIPLFRQNTFTPESFAASTGENGMTYYYLLAICGQVREPPQAPPIEPPQTAPQKSHRARKRKPAKKALPAHLKKDKAFRRAQGRVLRDFDKKTYIGDILLSDEDYAKLLEYVRWQLKTRRASLPPETNDPLLATALVQIGLRRYDGNFWGNAAKELGCELGPQQQGYLGQFFNATLQGHNKFVLRVSERVNSILFHAFVSDYYAKGLFELLFQYYVRDLERDINRNTPEQMQSLMDTLVRSSEMDAEAGEAFASRFSPASGKGSQAYKLKHHTLDAISAYPGHSRMRLRRLLRLIDRAFWRDALPKNPSSRLTIRFKEWAAESSAFRQECQRYKSGEIRNRGKKHFSSPYLFAELACTRFWLKLPAQVIHDDSDRPVEWLITTQAGPVRLPAETYSVVTGRKTEECRLELSEDVLFGQIDSCLVSGEDTLRRFSIMPQRARFFDMEGDYSDKKLFRQPMCAFTPAEETLSSPALTDRVPLGGLTRWELQLEDGDVVVLPGGESRVVGERFEDGFLPRGRLTNAVYAPDSEGGTPVYGAAPTLLLTVPQSKRKGTALDINGSRHSLGTCETIEFCHGDAKGVCAFLLPLEQFPECRDMALNTVTVDVPGALRPQVRSFALLRGFSAVFDDAPYVFAETGAVGFPRGFSVTCSREGVERDQETNGLLLPLNACETLEVTVSAAAGSLPLTLTIPQLLWSTDKENWHAQAMGETWHTEFPHMLYLRSPSPRLWLGTDSDTGDDDEVEEHSVPAEPAGGGLYKLDLTRFRTWLTRDKVAHDVTLKLDKTEYDLAKVYARSYVALCEVTADFEKSLVCCDCDIIGKANYYVDIREVGASRLIASKQPLLDGHIAVPEKHLRGRYQVDVFEAEDDDSGFEGPTYFQICSVEETLIDKDDLSGLFLQVWKIRPARHSALFTELRGACWVEALEKAGPGRYTGQMLLPGETQQLSIKVVFPDKETPHYFQLSFWDEEEGMYIPFIFDRAKAALTQQEPCGLKRSERYRRYKMIDEGYLFYGALRDRGPDAAQEA